MNKKIAFKDYKYIVRESEMMLPSIPIGPGKFSDTGYRFRKNMFKGLDHWVPFMFEKDKDFWDYIFYSTDTVDVVPDNKWFGSRSQIIAKMYFRIDIEKIEHSRQVYRLMDWLGDVGGVGDVLSFGFMLFFGGYLSFNQEVCTMKSLYCDHADDGSDHDCEGGAVEP